MTIERAILELTNMIGLFEDARGINRLTRLTVTDADIEAVRMGIDALNEQKKREDDRR